MENIDPKKEYGLLQIVALNVMGKTAVTVSRNILLDRLGANLLKAEVEGSSTASRYKIKGSNLIKYLEQNN